MQNFVGKTKCIVGYMKVADWQPTNLVPSVSLLPAAGSERGDEEREILGTRLATPENSKNVRKASLLNTKVTRVIIVGT